MEVAVGGAVAAAALGARYLITAFTSSPTAPTVGARLISLITSSTTRTFYKGGFEPVMTKREAALILGLRQSAINNTEKVKEAYKRVMLANHPDAGGSPFIARKVNEARDLLIRKTSNTGSVF